jgi:hypothetical protein
MASDDLIDAAPSLLRAAQNLIGSGVEFYEHNGEPKVLLRNDRWVFVELMAVVSDALGEYDEAKQLRASCPPPLIPVSDHRFRPSPVPGEDYCLYSWRVESDKIFCQQPRAAHADQKDLTMPSPEQPEGPTPDLLEPVPRRKGGVKPSSPSFNQTTDLERQVAALTKRVERLERQSGRCDCMHCVVIGV